MEHIQLMPRKAVMETAKRNNRRYIDTEISKLPEIKWNSKKINIYMNLLTTPHQ